MLKIAEWDCVRSVKAIAIEREKTAFPPSGEKP